MINPFAFLAPIALLIPIAQTPDDAASLTPAPPTRQAQFPDDWLTLDAGTDIPVQRQIRIERRVVIRVSPYRPPSNSARTSLTAEPRASRSAPPRKLVEHKMGKCFETDAIRAVRTTRDNRLLLYMNDRRMIAVNLEKSCSARDFYQGFYVEPNKDGKLCVKRERLQSRTGVKCRMDRIRQLVPDGD
ncbi:MAG: hypothetical protein WA948_01485 [Pontixanthobacter sp.]